VDGGPRAEETETQYPTAMLSQPPAKQIIKEWIGGSKLQRHKKTTALTMVVVKQRKKNH